MTTKKPVSIRDIATTIGAIALIVTTSFGAVGYFETKTHAAEAAQQAQKSVEELRAEILLSRIKVLNDKPTLTANEKTELDLSIAQVKQIQAGAKK